MASSTASRVPSSSSWTTLACSSCLSPNPTDVQIVLNDSVSERRCLFLLPADQRAGLAPLFEAQLDLQPPDMIFRPSLEFGAVDGFYDLVEGLVNDVYRIASLVPRLTEHSAFPHYQVCASCRRGRARAQSDRPGQFFFCFGTRSLTSDGLALRYSDT